MSKGKLTLKDKEEASQMSIESNAITRDYFYVDAAIRNEINKKGLVCRWINAKKLADNYGFDRRQWQPYKKEGTSVSTNPFGGIDSEGYIRRGDLILAVRPKEVHERNSQQIANKNSNLKKITNKQAANDLKDHFRQANIDAKVTDGYEDNE